MAFTCLRGGGGGHPPGELSMGSGYCESIIYTALSMMCALWLWEWYGVGNSSGRAGKNENLEN